MEALDIYQLEDLDKEWTKFLDSIPWNQEGTIPEINKRFEVKRMAWMKRMSKAYDVDIDALKQTYTH